MRLEKQIAPRVVKTISNVECRYCQSFGCLVLNSTLMASELLLLLLLLLLGLVYYLLNRDLLNEALTGKNIQLHNQFNIVTRIHIIKKINFVANL